MTMHIFFKQKTATEVAALFFKIQILHSILLIFCLI
jgi:hypothetical protein